MAKQPIPDASQLFRLDGKTAVVIGGAGFLGSAIARGLGEVGAKVAVTDLREDLAVKTAEGLGTKSIEALGLAMDALDRTSIQKGLDLVEDRLGPVGILVNAAGGNSPKATATPDQSFFGLDQEALEFVVRLNLMGGAILPCQVIGERMASRPDAASIINISSMAALRPLTRVVGYAASKAGVSNFTQWLAVYFAKELGSKVRVNAIAPGFFLTDQNRYLLTNEDGSVTPRGETILGHTPMGRYGEPEDLVGTAVWLASDASRFATGIVVPIDGGFSAFSGV